MSNWKIGECFFCKVSCFTSIWFEDKYCFCSVECQVKWTLEALQNELKRKYIVVLDTSILIKYNENLRKWKDLVSFYLPYTVLRELDGLKKSKKREKVNKSMNFIKEFFSLGYLEIQPVSDENICPLNCKIYTNDDRILCAAYKKQLNSNDNVIFLTEDQNQILKSKAWLIKSKTFSEMETFLFQL